MKVFFFILFLQIYVQDVMEKQVAEFVFDILYKNAGHLYVCGDVKMANDVTKGLKRICVKIGKMSEEKAEDWIRNIKVVHY